MIDRFINKVFHGNSYRLLQGLPTASVDAVVTDAMYGTAKDFQYDWGADPARGDPVKHWAYHKPIYEQCRRVLKPRGVLAWAQGRKFVCHFQGWFDNHRKWTLTRFGDPTQVALSNIWIVQTREQHPVEFPHRDSLVFVNRTTYLPLRELHPCPEPVEESAFMIESLTQPGQIVLDCFCGVGSSLIAAQQLGRRWIGCDLSKEYCKATLNRLARLEREVSESTSLRVVLPR